MKKTVSITILVFVMLAATSILAQNKVVVVPLGSGAQASSPAGQIIGGATAFNSQGSGNNYIPIGASQRTDDYDGSKTRIGLTGTISDFEGALQLSTTAGSYTFTIVKNNVDQTITCSVTGASTLSCTDLVNCVDVVAGDYVAVKAVGSGATNRMLRWSGVFTPGASCN